MSSTRRESFVRLAESRVIKTMNDIRLIGNLSNRNNYEYTAEDVAKIFSTLEQELKTAKSRFVISPGGKDSAFKL